MQVYMVGRGPEAHRAFIGQPGEPWDPEIRGKETIEDLRTKLLYGRERPPQPVPITVTGTLFPCALLSSGWWEKHNKLPTKEIKWKNDIQQWLFKGFDEWGPSWDFTWNFDQWEVAKQRPYFIAQLGDGDEANSLPVLIPGDKAKRLHQYIEEQKEKDKWGGIDAEVKGVLGHRSFFKGNLDPGTLELFGGLLDYCLWLDEDNPEHGIEPLARSTAVYSGYLWKCVAPLDSVADGKPLLNDVYFIWEHTNFASRDAVRYNLDSLARKEEYLRQRYGKFVLVQKSSSLVPGNPQWSPEEIYRILLRKNPTTKI
jgi:hypothetical protein